MLVGRGRDLLAAAVAAVSVTACAATSQEDALAGDEVAGGIPAVVVTTSILGDVVGNIAGEAAETTVLMPPGIDPHAFAPSAAQAAALRDADLVVANGLGLEEQLTDVLAGAESDGVRVLEVAAELDPLPYALADDEHAADDSDDAHIVEDDGDAHAGDADELDPHVWFDPVRMADAARLIATELAAVDDSLGDAEWQQRGEEYADDVLTVHAELEQIFGAIPDERRVLVTSHDNLAYLAERYDFEVVGAITGATTLADASVRDLAELAHTIEELGVRAIISETTASERVVDALAREVGGDVAVVTLFTDALGEPGSGADTYLGLLRTDARRIADALAR